MPGCDNLQVAVELSLTEDGRAVIRFNSGSRPIVAGVLGREVVEGVERIYLDRRIHRPWVEYRGWQLSGAISTIASRAL
jgi:hypothetical protein